MHLYDVADCAQHFVPQARALAIDRIEFIFRVRVMKALVLSKFP
jgi:hypothetical protein